RAVLEALGADGAEVRFVGGCVRDALADRPVNDVDLATADPPETVIALLRRAGLKAVPTGLDHGTITAVSHHRPFEVTTLRRDVETHGRHATVAFTDDWKADAARRDFTFNALSCRPDGTLFDPFGGQSDLEAGRVRFVGDARARIEEDYLRLLRFFRFQAHYGRGDPNPEGLAAATDLAPELAFLSGERIRNELFRLLEAEAPVPVLEVMRRQHILDAVLPQLRDSAVLAALLALRVEPSGPEVLLRLGALVEGGPAAATALAERLHLSRAERERLAGLLDLPQDLEIDCEGRALRRAFYRLGAERAADLLRLDWARRRAAGSAVDDPVARRALAAAAAWRPVPFPLKGRDALKLGMAPSESVGRLLAEVEAWWIAQDFRPSRAECLERLKELAAAGR
ncbi:MAG: CCA tRNA nucleotidyltransferase, partial [Rhodospirillales bacterium]|nr:CCA tRNA nucleotidyltransferase [Rhodospirillales bacterium]